MYARHLGWLNATPDESKVSRRESLSQGGEGSPFLAMPDVEEAEYLIRYWHEAGTCSAGGMGISPLTWQEIRAWRLESGYGLDHYEVDIVRMLSAEYCNEYHAASAKHREAPYVISEESFDRVAMGKKVKNVLAGFKRAKQDTSYEVVDRE